MIKTIENPPDEDLSQCEPALKSNRRAMDHWYFLTLVLMACLLYIRRPDALQNPQFWAEDGTLLFQDQQDLGLLAIFRPCAGYLMLIQRLLAIPGSWWGSANAPLVFNIIALIFVVFVGFIVLQSRIDMATWGKSLLALSLVLIPHSGEVYLNIANLQHITACLLVLIAIQKEPLRRFDAVSDFIILFFAGLSGPYIIILAPLFILRCVLTGWTSYNKRLLTVVSCLAIIQGTFLVNDERMVTGHTMSKSIDQWLTTIGVVFPGNFWFAWIPDFVPSAAFLVLTPLMLGCLAYIYLSSGRRFPILICFASGALSFAAALYSVKEDPSLIYRFWGIGRYFFLPYLCVTWALIFCVGEKGITRWSRAKQLATALILLTAVSASRIFVWPALPDMHWREYVENPNPSGTTTIPINPRGRFVILRSDSR